MVLKLHNAPPSGPCAVFGRIGNGMEADDGVKGRWSWQGGDITYYDFRTTGCTKVGVKERDLAVKSRSR